ncbi:MAG TPA: malic enzyme-like NAD(P)-binding protein [Spirochaetota bacterium]|nr:malic enzyme-like NAD(P)-binding protein [Spirochaetota bacterium]
MSDPRSYHRNPVPGKTAIHPTKDCKTQADLALAYTPGVAVPCLDIQKNPADAYAYTNRGNLVGVISNGTAVLGLGDIGALAGKPVMEGKAVLFKRFADIDVFDIEINEKDPQRLVDIIASLEPTFGGINLEDIKAPECFYVEPELQRRLSIPVFHDDQHGTAIITGAALVNALEIIGKNVADIRVVVNGAGAAGIACSDFYVSLGVRKEHVIMCDSKGVLYRGRVEGMNEQKNAYAVDTPARTLADAVKGADVFLGLSVAGALTPDMLKTMSNNPIVFACANPDPEILPDQARAARADVIMATGRSDFRNQVNNVLGFPFIFRGALDMKATCVNEDMKIAAARALARIAKEPVPDYIRTAYAGNALSFGPEYIIPTPFDHRVFFEVSSAVAEAAAETGVAREAFPGREAYRERLRARYRSSIARYSDVPIEV